MGIARSMHITLDPTTRRANDSAVTAWKAEASMISTSRNVFTVPACAGVPMPTARHEQSIGLSLGGARMAAAKIRATTRRWYRRYLYAAYVSK